MLSILIGRAFRVYPDLIHTRARAQYWSLPVILYSCACRSRPVEQWANVRQPGDSPAGAAERRSAEPLSPTHGDTPAAQAAQPPHRVGHRSGSRPSLILHRDQASERTPEYRSMPSVGTAHHALAAGPWPGQPGPWASRRWSRWTMSPSSKGLSTSSPNQLHTLLP